MKKVITAMLAIFIILFVVNAQANELWESYSTIEKSEDSRELYNVMPTEIKRGDIVSVKIVAKNIQGWQFESGESRISWDKNAFEIVETDGSYYTILNDNINYANIDFNRDSSIYVYYSWNSTIPYENTQDLIELKFKIKNDVKDGIYQISQIPSDDGLHFLINDNYEHSYATSQSLKYQIGKSKITSNYNKNDIEKSTYIIGNHLFTRDGSDIYDGILTTEYIMLASKSIESDSKDDMIIYAKNARGNWINAITNQPIDVPDEFKISYVNMRANYSENGVYSDNSDKTILRLVQINDKEAIITIESDKERVHGIASISNRVAVLKIGEKTYKITISDVDVNIETSDSYITTKKLQKRANVSINDYFNDIYSRREFDGNPIYYIKSDYTGKYVYGNYELYLLRIGEDTARICLKEKSTLECIYDEYVYSGMSGYYTELGEATYMFGLDEIVYGLDWNNNEIKIKCGGNCTNNHYQGTYTKESSLSLEDAFHVWEKNEIQYKVVLNKNNGEEPNVVYVTSGNRLSDDEYGWWYYEDHYKDGYEFVEWQLNGETYDFDTPVTKPITLVAQYEKLPSSPTLSISSRNYGNNNSIQYTLMVESQDYFDGFIVYQKSGPNEPIGYGTSGYSGTIDREVARNSVTEYYAKTYKIINGGTYYSEQSNEITLSPKSYIVQFNSNGGGTVVSQEVLEGEKALKPTNPVKNGFTFVEWLYNNQAFDFTTPITEDITLIARWENSSQSVNKCYYNSEGNSYIWTSNPKVNWMLVNEVENENECVAPSDSCSSTLMCTNGGSLINNYCYNGIYGNVTASECAGQGGYYVNNTCFLDKIAAVNSTTCTSCAGGKYLSDNSCVSCPSGYYCTGGTSQPITCPSGTTTTSNATNISDCIASQNPVNACYFDNDNNQYVWSSNPNANWMLVTSVTTENECVAPASTCCVTSGNGLMTTYHDAVACNQAKVLYGFNVTSGTCPSTNCTEGTYLNDNDECVICPAGYYCPGNNTDKVSCPAGTSSLDGVTSINQCSTCAAGYYSSGNGMKCTKCPAGHTSNSDHTGCIDISN